MAAIQIYVDPDASGANDGTSWTDAYTGMETAWQGIREIDYTGDDLFVDFRASSGTADTTTSDWDTVGGGVLPDSITLRAASGDEAVASGWDTARYRLSITTGAGLIQRLALPFNIIGLQIESNDGDALQCGPSGGLVDSCYVRADVQGVTMQSGAGTLNVRNSIITKLGTIGSSGSEGIIADSNHTGTLNADNNVVWGFDDGIENDGTGNTFNVRNCASFNNNDDFDGLTTAITLITNCASDDGDGTNPVTAPTWADVFEDAANGDFRLKSTDTDLTAAGTELSATFTNSINGVDRGSADWDIGPYQSAAAATGRGPLVHGKLVGGNLIGRI